MNIKKVFIPLLGLLFVLLAFVPVQANNINNNDNVVTVTYADDYHSPPMLATETSNNEAAQNNNLMMNNFNSELCNVQNNAVNNTNRPVSWEVAQTWYDSYNLGMQMSSGLNTSGNIVNKNMMKNLT